jgi:c-di-GMP-binding flagellar brake protein YcgR
LSQIYEALKAAVEYKENARAREVGEAARPNPYSTAASAVDAPQAVATVVAALKVAPPQDRSERRRSKRVKVALRAAVRNANAPKEQSPEIVATENSSRGGLCFRTASKHYLPGTQLLVAFPYHSHHDGVSSAEQRAVVLRTEALPGGRFSVTIVLGDTRKAAAPSTNERRQSPRSELSATASFQEEKSRTHVSARCSELSLGGCYIDTLNPLSVGTRLRVQIHKEDKIFECFARVCCSHPAAGMGLSFEDPSPDQISTLIEWLRSTWSD